MSVKEGILILIFLLDIPMDAGERAFIEELYGQYGGLMTGVAMKLLYRHEQDSQDAVQNALVKLCRVVSTLQRLEGNKLERYIVHTVRNAAVDLIRSRHPERNAGEGELPFLLDPQPSVEDEVMSALNLERLSRDISRLGEKHRDILYLHDVIGWKDREIAAYMHLAPSSVRVYLKQARGALGLRKGRGLYEDDINE